MSLLQEITCRMHWNHLSRDVLIFRVLRTITDFSEMILAAELCVAAALFSLYTQVDGKVGGLGGLLYCRAFFKKQQSGRRVVSCFIEPFKIREGNTNVWCHRHMAF